jgi:hypothetical protein
MIMVDYDSYFARNNGDFNIESGWDETVPNARQVRLLKQLNIVHLGGLIGRYSDDPDNKRMAYAITLDAWAGNGFLYSI